MNHHLLWLWLWFQIGVLAYMGQRAFYMITGPRRVATSLGQFVARAGVPLLYRWLGDSLLYWLCFTPQILASLLRWLNCEDCAYVISIVTQFAPCACVFGLTVDVVVDFGISTIVHRIPILGGLWPQMPSPLPSDPCSDFVTRNKIDS